MAYKKFSRGRPARRINPRVRKVKKMIGEQPSMVERIASGVGSVAKLASAIVPLVTAINTEEKYFDTTASVNPLKSTPTIQALNLISQGLTDSTRIGNSIKAQSLMCRFHFSGNFAAQPVNVCRYMLVVDKAVNAATPVAAPTLSLILEQSSNLLSPINKDQGDRFVILKDKIFTLNLPGTGGGHAVLHKEFKKLDFHIRYVAPNSTDLGPNAIYLIFWTDQTVQAPTITYYTRLKYTDN